MSVRTAAGGRRRSGRSGRAVGSAVALVLVLASCASTPPAAPPPTYAVDYPASCGAPDPADCRGMLVIGDSVAAGEGYSLALDARWQDQVAFALAGGDRTGVVRRRFNGDVLGSGSYAQWDFARGGFSGSMWANLPQYLPPAGSFGHLDQIVLAVGANDEGQNVPPVTYGVALRSLLVRYPADRCAVVASWEWEAAFKPTGFTPTYPATPYREQAAAVAADMGCAFVDQGALTSAGVAEMPWSPDGQHLSQAGHDEIARRLLAAINPG